MGKCTLCDKPAVGAINANANMSHLYEARWEPRCDEHNPYWNPLPPDLTGDLRWALKMIERAGDLTWTEDDKTAYWTAKRKVEAAHFKGKK